MTSRPGVMPARIISRIVIGRLVCSSGLQLCEKVQLCCTVFYLPYTVLNNPPQSFDLKQVAIFVMTPRSPVQLPTCTMGSLHQDALLSHKTSSGKDVRFVARLA